MELLLKNSVESLGEMGEIVNVSAGYARNYLIPKGYAEILTPAALLKVQALKKKLEEQTKTEERKQKDMLTELESRESFTVMCEADENGHLYGSVSESMIAELLQEEGFRVEKKQIIIEEPIKTCDIFSLDVKIGEDTAQIKLWVVAK